MAYTITQQAFTTGGRRNTHNVYQTSTSKTQEIIAHELTDNGGGLFGPYHGVCNYAARTLSVRVASQDNRTQSYNSDFEDAEVFADLSMSNSGSGGGGSNSAKGGAYTTAAMAEELLAGSTVYVAYSTGFAGATAHTQNYAPPLLSIDLCPLTADYVVPGSVQFTWMGHVYRDFEGVIYRGRTDTNPGIASGTMDYGRGVAHMTDWVVNGNPENFTLDSLWTRRQPWKTATIVGRTQSAPLAPGGFVLTLTDTAGNALTANVDPDGLLVGAHMLGRLNLQTGVYELQFGDYVLDSALTAAQKLEWWYDPDDVGAVQAGKIWRPWPVDPTTLRYNSVAYFYLPLDPELLGLDPVGLPQDGRVPIFRPGGDVVIGNTKTTGPVTVTNGQTIDTGRVRLSRVRITGADGEPIHTGYLVAHDAGLIEIMDVTGWDQPVTIEDRVEDMAVILEVDIGGRIKLNKQLTHDYPAPGSYISSALMAGDLRARVSVTFAQATWEGQIWSDTLIGNPGFARYNDIAYPIEVTNAGALTERYVLRFTTTIDFQLIAEHMGVIAVGNINNDFAPMSPQAPGVPLMVIRAAGWGLTGWAPGNILRVNTIGAIFTIDVIRTTQAGPAAGLDYKFGLLIRGDVDRPPVTP